MLSIFIRELFSCLLFFFFIFLLESFKILKEKHNSLFTANTALMCVFLFGFSFLSSSVRSNLPANSFTAAFVSLSEHPVGRFTSINRQKCSLH